MSGLLLKKRMECDRIHIPGIFFCSGNYRFIGQFLLLIFLFSLPLMWGIALHGQALDLLLLFGAIADCL
jgi:hypothetical protein